jgi:hypothetical protein
MTLSGRHAVERIREIKHLSPSDQAAALADVSSELLHTASSIRSALGLLSGVIVTVTIQGSDREVVVLALLAFLAHDIATLPDFQLRAKSMALHGEVIRQVGIDHRDAEFFHQNLRLFEHVLMG